MRNSSPSPDTLEEIAGFSRIVLASNYNLEELITGALDHLSARDYTLDFMTVLHPGVLPPPQGITGILASVATDALAQWVTERDCPVVQLFLPHEQLSAWPLVTPDWQAVGQLGARHLLELGNHHLAYYQFYTEADENLCYEGFLREAEAHGRTVHHVNFGLSYQDETELSLTSAQTLNWLQAQLRALPLPLACMTSNSSTAVELVLAARLLKLRIPEDIAILGTDDQPLRRKVVPEQISSIELDIREISRRGSELLVRLLQGAKPGSDKVPMLVEVPPKEITLRASTATFTCDHPGVTSAARLICRRFQEPLTIPEVAAHACMSVRSLQAEYPRYVGCTVTDDIRRKRLKLAEDLLKSTDLKLDAIAMEAGLGSAAYLCRLFQAKHLMTPDTWRKQHCAP